MSLRATGQRKYYQLIPIKIIQNISHIEDVIQPTIKGYSRDYLFEVISIVACHARKNGDPAQLQQSYIKKLVPQGDKYLRELIKIGIIQRSGHPKIKVCSYRYKLSPEYQWKYSSFLLNNPKLIIRIDRARAEKCQERKHTIRGHSEQVKYLNLLTIDDYLQCINATYSYASEKYIRAVGSATRIKNKDFSYSRDDTSGRLHSNLTNMPKALRKVVRIKGERLINIDLKNSQLYFSVLLLTNPSKVAGMTKNKAFALLLRTLKVPNNQDVKEYISLAVSGKIYEFLVDEFSKDGLILTRDQAKKQALRILYARNRMPRDETNRKARQIFKKLFPTVYKIFSKIRGSESGDRFMNFKRFPILLQTIESHLILDVILKRIYKELPGTIAVTIHDSIMTGVNTDNVEAICKIMVDELTSFVGFVPKMEIE